MVVVVVIVVVVVVVVAVVVVVVVVSPTLPRALPACHVRSRGSANMMTKRRISHKRTLLKVP